ncbi:hypothetical protein, partial [Streptomyces sp. NPDC048425]|uniref:hypothetical protein n=1 Tax=Streptomyces sp. NPDC048425 TaxID=3365548 RepID=UPI003713E021
ENPDGVNETNTPNDDGFGVQLPIDPPANDTEAQSGTHHPENPDGVNETNTPNDDGFGVQLPIDPPANDTEVQSRIQAPF